MQGQPCHVPESAYGIFLAVLNVFQVVIITWLANRAHRRDVKERRMNGNGSKDT